MSFEKMPFIGRSSRYRKFRIGYRLSSGARLLGHWAAIGSRNEDFDPPVLGLPLGSLVAGDRRRVAFAVGLEAIRLGQEGPEQGRNALRALDGQMVVVGKAGGSDRCIVGVSDDFYEAVFLVECRGNTACDRPERVEHGGRARSEQDDVADL